MKQALLVLAFVAFGLAAAQERPDAAAILAAQREALAQFAFLDGVWRGTATHVLPSGAKSTLTQTERIGPMLDGTLRVIEGRGYLADGRKPFNSFGVISYDPASKAYSMRSYAMGHSGDFSVRRTGDGFAWEIAAGPATLRYTAVVKDGTWTEVGDRLVPGQAPVRFFEMKLTRVGDSEWPAGGAIGP